MSHGGPEIEVPYDEHDPFTKRVALSVAIFAVILAIAGLGGKNAGKDMLSEQIEAANRWNQYQAKANRAFVAENELEKEDGLTEKNRERLKKRLEKYEKDKEEIMAQAREHEANRDKAHKKDNYFDYAELLLQISIVIASVSMLSKSHYLWIAAIVLVLVASVLTINGYTLMFHLGFIEGGGH